MSNEQRVVLETDDMERLANYFVAKHRRVIGPGQVDDFNLYAVIITVMTDLMLVERGDLSIEDFNPEGTVIDLGTIVGEDEYMDLRGIVLAPGDTIEFRRPPHVITTD
jgi:hypothetical protein